jgi:hypothetical protein
MVKSGEFDQTCENFDLINHEVSKYGNSNALKTSFGKFLQLIITFSSLTAIILYVKFNY